MEKVGKQTPGSLHPEHTEKNVRKRGAAWGWRQTDKALEVKGAGQAPCVPGGFHQKLIHLVTARPRKAGLNYQIRQQTYRLSKAASGVVPTQNKYIKEQG